jgi:GNAT superfamily N-acetyltransferase
LGLPVSRDAAVTVWSWILSSGHVVEAVVAERSGKLVGFAHYRSFPRTLDGNEACYLDDIFVSDDERGKGTARALIDEVERIASARGWTHVRWVTDEDNVRARRFYEKFAERTNLITYRVPRVLPLVGDERENGG